MNTSRLIDSWIAELALSGRKQRRLDSMEIEVEGGFAEPPSSPAGVLVARGESSGPSRPRAREARRRMRTRSGRRDGQAASSVRYAPAS